MITIKEALGKLQGFYLSDVTECHDNYFVIKDDKFTVVYNNIAVSKSRRGFEVIARFNGILINAKFDKFQDVIDYCNKSYDVYDLLRSSGK